MRKKPPWPLILLFLLIVTVGIYSFWGREKNQDAAPTSNEQTSSAPKETPLERIPVKTWPAQKRDLEVSLSVFGAVTYTEKADVAPEKTTYEVLKKVLVEPGDLVKKGQIVALMDTDLLQADLKAKVAQIAQTEAQLQLTAWKRQANRKLYKAGAAPLSDLEEAEANDRATKAALERAKAEMEMTRTQIKKATIRSPIDGIVAYKNFSEGERIPNQSDKGVVTVMRLNEVYVEAEISEKDIAKLKDGLDVTIVSDAYPQSRLKGRLERLDPVLKEQSRTMVAKVRVANPDALLKPGMFTHMGIILDKVPQALAVPKEALRQGPDKTWQVFVIVDNISFSRKVVIGLITDFWAEIKSGLQAGDLVVVEGGDRIKELSRVVATPASLPSL